jgi:hypothetical protein
MLLKVKRLAWRIALCASVLSTLTAQAEDPSYRGAPDRDLPLFLSQLPKYCYAQYFDTKQYGNPEYSIIAACGVGMNHFCPGLLNIMRAEYRIDPKRFNRREELRWAKENVNYTIARLNPSSCRYTQDIMAAKQKVEILEKIIR